MQININYLLRMLQQLRRLIDNGVVPESNAKKRRMQVEDKLRSGNNE